MRICIIMIIILMISVAQSLEDQRHRYRKWSTYFLGDTVHIPNGLAAAPPLRVDGAHSHINK